MYAGGVFCVLPSGGGWVSVGEAGGLLCAFPVMVPSRTELDPPDVAFLWGPLYWGFLPAFPFV